MSNGRSEKRIVKTVSLEVCLPAAPKLSERLLTEDVSAHGARVIVEQKLQPVLEVPISWPGGVVWSQARTVYCQRVSKEGFAVGLELPGRVESWTKSYDALES